MSVKKSSGEKISPETKEQKRTTLHETYPLLGLAAFVGFALTLWSTHLGPGVGGDATIYLTSAQNLAKGIGLGLVQPDGSFRLLPYSAPLFPLILSPFAALGLDLTSVARWLNILLFVGLILLVGYTSLKLTANKWWGLLPAGLMAVSPILLPVYSWAMAEPITLMLGFGGLAVVLLKIDREPANRLGWLEVSGLLLGLAISARYSAAAFLVTGLLLCLLWLKLPFWKRVLAAFRMGIIGIIPIAIWVMVQLGQTATVSARTLLTFNEMIFRFTIFCPQLNSAILVWLLPASAQSAPSTLTFVMGLLPAFTLIVLAVVSIRVAKKTPESAVNRWVSALWLFCGIYVGILLLVYLTTYPPITIDNRMLSPAHTAVIWILGLLLARLFEIDQVRPLKIAVAIAMIGLVAWFGVRTIRIVRQNAETGLGYNAVTWRQSQLIAAIKMLPEGQKLVTNEAMALLYLTGRVAEPVAEIYADKPVYPFTRYGDGPARNDPAEAEFKAANSLLIVFDTLESQFASIYGDKAAERAKVFTEGLRVVAFGENGAMYYYPVDFSKQQ
jgi:hypothetical protein